MVESQESRRVRFEAAYPDISKKLLRRFWEWHDANPHILTLFERFTLEAYRAGRKRFSAWAVAQRIRWFTEVETSGDDFKLRNDFIAIYARAITFRHPELDGFFDLRKMDPDRRVHQPTAKRSGDTA